MTDIDKLKLTNKNLSNFVQQYSTSKDMPTPVVNPNMSFTPILKQLILNAEKNVESLPNHQRHSEI